MAHQSICHPNIFAFSKINYISMIHHKKFDWFRFYSFHLFLIVGSGVAPDSPSFECRRLEISHRIALPVMIFAPCCLLCLFSAILLCSAKKSIPSRRLSSARVIAQNTFITQVESSWVDIFFFLVLIRKCLRLRARRSIPIALWRHDTAYHSNKLVSIPQTGQNLTKPRMKNGLRGNAENKLFSNLMENWSSEFQEAA